MKTPWKPTTQDLELIVSHGTGKIPAHITAKELGVEVADLIAFSRKLAIGHALAINPPPPDDDERPSIPAGFPTINK